MSPRLLALSLGLVAGGVVACADESLSTETSSAETSGDWERRGFAKMVGPLRSPTSADGSDLIEVWIAIPGGSSISVRHREGAPHLVLPEGTAVDRVESIRDARGAFRVDDVRGTTLTAGGGQTFHVSRRLGETLRGFSWPRGSALEQARVDDALAELLAGHGEQPMRVRRLVDLNQCTSCHGAARPASVETGSRLPNRPTDEHGFHQIEGVLSDHAPAESSRPHDPNVGDPWIRYRCRDGTAPDVATDGPARRLACRDTSVPVGTLDVAGALAAGDAHARDVCASRAALHAHMDEAARAAFAPAFSVCGIGPDGP